jgi:hypothetical protein
MDAKGAQTMDNMNWKRRLLGLLGAGVLGFGSAAWANGGDARAQQELEEAEQSAQQAGQQVDQAAEDAFGGSGNMDVDLDADIDMNGDADTSAQSDTSMDEGTGGAGTERDAQGNPISRAAGRVGDAVENATEEVQEFFEERPKAPETRVMGMFGVAGFTGPLGDQLNAGPTWGVRAGRQMYGLFGLEAGYSGNRASVASPLAPANGAALTRHGLDVLAKAGPRLDNGLRPFGGVGLGVALVNPNDAADTIYTNGFMAEVPLAAGVEYDIGNITAGVRADYRFLHGENWALLAANAPGQDEGSLLSGLLTVGGRF